MCRFILLMTLYIASLNISRLCYFRSFSFCYCCCWNRISFFHSTYQNVSEFSVNCFYFSINCSLFPFNNSFLCHFFRRLLEQHMHCHREMVAVRVFDCPEKDCLFSGRSAAELRVHQTTHSSEKTFCCMVTNCSYKTKTNVLLKR